MIEGSPNNAFFDRESVFARGKQEAFFPLHFSVPSLSEKMPIALSRTASLP